MSDNHRSQLLLGYIEDGAKKSYGLALVPEVPNGFSHYLAAVGDAARGPEFFSSQVGMVVHHLKVHQLEKPEIVVGQYVDPITRKRLDCGLPPLELVRELQDSLERHLQK